MTNNAYEPPEIWTHDSENGGKFASINRPTAGARYEHELPRGNHPFQLYSLATPNGVKVTVLLEELLAAGVSEAEYDAYTIDISEGEQFSSGFVDINPNSKIPALVDTKVDSEITLFESASIMVYLAEKFDRFLPKDTQSRAKTFNWLFWQMGSAPFLGGGFGHFYAYAPEKYEYPINRYTMEVKRQLDVLNQHLSTNEYLVGDEYTIADMAVWPWYGVLVLGGLYNAATFLQVEDYEHVLRWAKTIGDRTPVKKGQAVNRVWGDETKQLAERHSDDDFVGIVE